VCTLLYLPWQSGPFTAAIGLNRDEDYARPAAPPRWWEPTEGGAGFVAPVDLRAGGTWFGLAETGLFVALTNGRQTFAFRHERSRGELVAETLRLGRLEAAIESLTARDALAYGPCHIMLAQGSQVAYVAPDESGRFTIHLLEQRAHTLTNTGLDAGDTPQLPEDATGETPDEAIAQLRAVLATHTGPMARCRHGQERGTRSSAVLLLGPDLERSRLLFADGPPCVTEFEEVPLGELARPGVAAG
jgi:hypothetical protein